MINSLAKNKIYIMLFFIIVFGSFMRIYKLDFQSLWNDELATWEMSRYESVSDVMTKGIIPDNHPPGYQLIMHFVIQTFGSSESALRFPSVLAGILSILVIFFFAKQLYGKREGILAAVLLAFSWAPVYYSQEARAYSLLLLFSLFTTWQLYSIFTKNYVGSKKYWLIAGYTISAITMAYLHYFGLYFILLQGMFSLAFSLKCKKNIILMVVMFGIIGLSYVPWLPSMLQQLGRTSWMEPPSSLFFFYYLGFIFNKSFIFLAIACSILLYLTFQVLISNKFTSNSKETQIFLFLMLWFLVPYAGAHLKSFVSTPIVSWRNLIISLPAAYLLLARGIGLLLKQKRFFPADTVTIAIILIVHLVFGMNYYKTQEKEQFRQTVGHIVEHQDSENASIIAYAWSPEYLNYYFNQFNSSQSVNLVAGDSSDVATIDHFLNTTDNNYIWYVAAHKKSSDKVIEFLEQKMELVEFDEFIETKLWLFKRISPSDNRNLVSKEEQ